MTKKLMDTFMEFNFSDTLREIFAEAEVSRIVFDKKNEYLDIELKLVKMAHPEEVQDLEKRISAHLRYKTRIHEFYDLQKNLEQVYPLFSDILFYHLGKWNPFISNALRMSEVKVEGNTISYRVPAVGYEYMMPLNPEEKIKEIFEAKLRLAVEIYFQKKDEKNQILQEFIQNRDLESKMMLQPAVDETEIVTAPLKKEIEKPEGIIFGKKEIKGEITPVSDLSDEKLYYNLDVEIVGSVDVRDLASGKKMFKLFLTDYKKTVCAKLFAEDKEAANQLISDLKAAKALRVFGKYEYNKYDKEMIFTIQTIQPLPESIKAERVDDAEEKRIELHCHTQMSDMDGVIPVKTLIKQAAKWGHPAVAVTDTAVVQAFPDAFSAWKGVMGDRKNAAMKRAEERAKENGTDKDEEFQKEVIPPMKIIYGMTAFMVDDERPIVWFEKGQSLSDSYVVFDIETTGLVTSCDTLTEIGAVKIENGMITERFSQFINPNRPIPRKIQELTHITDEMVKTAPTMETVLPEFMEFCKGSVLVAHNSDFDISFIKKLCQKIDLPTDFTYMDTLEIARHLYPDFKRYGLDYLCKELDINLSQHHRAVYDAEATAGILLKMFESLKEKGIENLSDLVKWGEANPINWEKQRPTQIMILTKTRQGLLNLYKMVSESHINTFAGVPRLKKSYLRTMRDGLIIGATGGNNDFYQAFVEGRCEELIERLSGFYDYFELYPIEVARAYVDKDVIEQDTVLASLQMELYQYVKALDKKVVASSAAKILNPEDEILRRILLVGKKTVRNADRPDYCYFRTTKEMFQAFSYFEDAAAREMILTAPKEIADSLDVIEPVERDKYAPVIANSENELKEMCYQRAHEIYGNPLPEIVEERLSRELNSIINNGFSVMYIIAQKLVKKSNDDGYLVGSRGSVGSSFAATMSGITEVNPLTAHYVCPTCKYSDFSPPELELDPAMSGADLPDRNCPKCGAKLNKDGHDIPFETFLGFYGDKEPDIDLNFSGEYQSCAHEYTEVIFGKEFVFRAGTIGTLADKTAYGFVKNYFEERNIELSEGDINRYVQGCVGVRRTTGQHPGGIIVVPKDQEIYKFTPIQKPANDRNSTIITTHFDYHSIDHNLLKLDILGHDDPTMIRFLEDLTGVDAKTIPLDEQKVMSLFQSTEALGVTPADIGGIEMGSLGVPEFGTDFVIQMLKETKPKAFSDLIRISGLSHGTDVWTNNGQEMIQKGLATINTVISTRDGIMSYLINQGMEKGLSFNIMESVRKGKGLRNEWVEAMQAANVPEWYIESCRRIKYMFPKAHAAAYVMMAFRIAYFKVYYPLEYYTAYFSIRASNFDYVIMARGRDVLEEAVQELKERSEREKLSKKEMDMDKEIRIAREMYARGFSFHKIDLYQSEATRFKIVDGKILPSFCSLNGMGEKAALSIVEARKDSEFLSVEDLVSRTKLSKTLVDLLKENDILGDLPDTNQISLF
ncbi:MAG: PolC-type DNA polymerase III [Eubacteriales bacterium]|nr:PolC-type DNA polymerase III [Eubacteriales bacterium]